MSAAALRPLFEMFWTSEGWRDQPLPLSDVAVEAGLMFVEPRTLCHDEWVAAARAAAASLDVGEVSNAFLASLSTRRLDLRSALGSYAIARVLPDHSFAARDGTCDVCGLAEVATEDLNVLNFERFKWGGVRRDEIPYLTLDLEQFALAPRPAASAEDLRIGRELISTLDSLPARVTAAQAVGKLTMVKGNKDERGVLLDILGVCDILHDDEHRGYREGFVTAADRDLPTKRFVEHAYPTCWWTGSNGIDHTALPEFLPALLPVGLSSDRRRL
ncbi:hypothetical protein GCM10009687_03970 [Asanoa iriomotensis]|uniref:Uncharacterized protein n=1 Tax=Asanoa iriomotensis TaxID=234613 RepID=A0ABQ4C2U6_9ACTN|nr:hypothetical protein Air01nite_32040 [Asanoa iriomotensis]